MSGSVKTNIVKPHTLPEGSMYAPYEEIYQEKRVKPIMGVLHVDLAARVVVRLTVPTPVPYISGRHGS